LIAATISFATGPVAAEAAASQVGTEIVVLAVEGMT
jgi:hypothetical protein